MRVIDLFAPRFLCAWRLLGAVAPARAASCLLFVLLLLPLLALAQPYSPKFARIIVPFPAGGTIDVIARTVQPKFEQFLGVRTIIENKSGAGGSVGAAEAARAAPDGYTLLIVVDTHAINHHIYKAVPDPFKTFDHLMLMVTSPLMLVAAPDFSASNLKDVIQYAKREPGKVTYASIGTASAAHLHALSLEELGGIKMLHVPYKGGAPLVQALMTHEVDISFATAALITRHLKSGKVKGIATGSRQRLSQMPELPTLAETFPGVELVSWFGLLAPIGVPRDVAARIHSSMARALAVPEVRKRLTDIGFDVVASSPEEFLRRVQEDSAKLGKLIRDNNIKVE